MPSKSLFSNRNFMAIVALVGSIHAASADEASDAVQVLLKLWKANLEASNQVCGGWKILKTEFVGDGKMYKMRLIHRLEDGKVEDSVDEAPFRFLEEGLPGGGSIPMHCRYQWSPGVGVRCLFERDCISSTTLTYDPIYNPNAQPKMRRSRADLRPPDGGPSGPPVISDPVSFGAVDPANADAVRRALRTLLRFNAAAPFEQPAPR
jgi:hypothetical protein